MESIPKCLHTKLGLATVVFVSNWIVNSTWYHFKIPDGPMKHAVRGRELQRNTYMAVHRFHKFPAIYITNG